jgi:hypothetical protein
MRPCDCKDRHTAMTQLREQGIGFADVRLTLEPAVVELRIGPCTLRIPQRHFQRLAEWYLEDQEAEDK